MTRTAQATIEGEENHIPPMIFRVCADMTAGAAEALHDQEMSS
jgi:hypothetical protein